MKLDKASEALLKTQLDAYLLRVVHNQEMGLVSKLVEVKSILNEISSRAYGDDWDWGAARIHAFTDELISKIKAGREYSDNIPRLSDLFTMSDWLDNVADGSIDNLDGHGYYCKDDMMCIDDEVFSSEPEDATHVCWFNK